MTAESKAQEHLRAIRQLMERATSYRAISVPTALVGGLLSLALAGAMLYWQAISGDRHIPATTFFGYWMLILCLTAAANTLFIFRGAARRNEPIVSAGMKHALRALAPSFLAGGVLSACYAWRLENHPSGLVLIWQIFYGLGLLATMSFAPRSIVYLGAAFLVTGLTLIALSAFWKPGFLAEISPAAIMGATFGAYHLCYAAFVWTHDRSRALDAPEERPLVTDAHPHLP